MEFLASADVAQIEVGTIATFIAFVVGAFMCVGGFIWLPDPVKKTACAVVLMFIGWQIIEFIATAFIVIAR